MGLLVSLRSNYILATQCFLVMRRKQLLAALWILVFNLGNHSNSPDNSSFPFAVFAPHWIYNVIEVKVVGDRENLG